VASDPRQELRAWLPHIVTIAALVAAVLLLADVVAPLFEPILLAAALAILTAPVLAQPLNRYVDRRFPSMRPELRRKVAGIAATVALLLLALAPIALAVVSQARNLGELGAKLRGVVLRDPATIDAIAASVVAQVDQINAHYEKLKLPAAEIGKAVREFLGESLDVNSAFVSFLRAGSGTVAQIALALIALAYFNIDGPRLARAFLSYAPLTDEQRERLVDEHRRVVLKLLSDTIATAAVKGLVLASIVWLVDHALGSGQLPFIPIAFAATLITLLPLVGVTMVWLPFAGLAWSQGNHVGAAVLAVLCWTANFFIVRWRDRIGRKLHERSEWLGFLLLLGVIGGLLSYGPKGLLIGPFAVVMAITIGRAWLPLYVADGAPDLDATPGGDDAAAAPRRAGPAAPPESGP